MLVYYSYCVYIYDHLMCLDESSRFLLFSSVLYVRDSCLKNIMAILVDVLFIYIINSDNYIIQQYFDY